MLDADFLELYEYLPIQTGTRHWSRLAGTRQAFLDHLKVHFSNPALHDTRGEYFAEHYQ